MKNRIEGMQGEKKEGLNLRGAVYWARLQGALQNKCPLPALPNHNFKTPMWPFHPVTLRARLDFSGLIRNGSDIAVNWHGPQIHRQLLEWDFLIRSAEREACVGVMVIGWFRFWHWPWCGFTIALLDTWDNPLAPILNFVPQWLCNF